MKNKLSLTFEKNKLFKKHLRIEGYRMWKKLLIVKEYTSEIRSSEHVLKNYINSYFGSSFEKGMGDFCHQMAALGSKDKKLHFLHLHL